MHVFNCTWNVNMKSPKPSLNLIHLFQDLKITPDLVCVGLQELLPQYTAFINYVHYSVSESNSSTRLQSWIDKIQSALREKFNSEYTIVFAGHMCAIGLIILSKDSMLSKIENVQFGSVGTGLLGIYGNKGAIAVGMNIIGWKSICIISSHLGPHSGKKHFDWRNEEIKSIFKTLVLSDSSYKKANWIQDFDLFILCGDLNYRLMHPNCVKRVNEHIDSQDIDSLLKMDELNHARLVLKLDPFDHLEECSIEFLPSYKFKILKDSIDTRSVSSNAYSSKRVPAYCDRILYSTSSEIKCKLYTCVFGLLGFSDHQPVVKLFEIYESATSTEFGKVASRNYSKLMHESLYYRCIRVYKINRFRIFFLLVLSLIFYFRF
jgi:hypothetical protein